MAVPNAQVSVHPETGENLSAVPVHKRIRAAIESAFAESRAFPFSMSDSILSWIGSNKDATIPSGLLDGIQNEIYRHIAAGDSTVEQRLRDDVRVSSCIAKGIGFFHHAAYELDDERLLSRRIVMIKEPKGVPALYYDGDTTAVMHI